jgi:hypothetical protein
VHGFSSLRSGGSFSRFNGLRGTCAGLEELLPDVRLGGFPGQSSEYSTAEMLPGDDREAEPPLLVR